MNPKLLSLFLTVLFLVACEESNPVDQTDSQDQVHTQDINLAPQFFKLGDGSSVSTDYDLTFQSGGMAYEVMLHSTAGVLAAATDTLAFDTNLFPAVGFLPDSSEMVIGSSWMDASTYNPANHGISSNAMVYFLRTTDYRWVKFRVLSATPEEFQCEYAMYNDDAGYETPTTVTIPYSSEAPARFSFASGGVVEPADWDLAFATTPEFSMELQTNFFMPTLLLNALAGVRCAVLDDAEFEDVLDLPGNVEWLDLSTQHHPLGNQGSHQVIVYHPEPPYNHQVIIEAPERIYFIETGNTTYKLQFDTYSSGIVLFHYAAL